VKKAMTETNGLELASSAVNVRDVKPQLMGFVTHLATIHLLLFGKDLVVTSGKDAIHATGSLHSQGRAVDVRIKDLDAEAQLLFLAILSYAAVSNQVAFFDERALGDESHIHIEYHGS
jgi:hypothetical protein